MTSGSPANRIWWSLEYASPFPPGPANEGTRPLALPRRPSAALSRRESGRGNELGGEILDALEHRALDLVQPPVVLDHADNAQESGSFLRGQEEEKDALCALGLHGGSVRRARPPVGSRSVNAVRTSG